MFKTMHGAPGFNLIRATNLLVSTLVQAKGDRTSSQVARLGQGDRTRARLGYEWVAAGQLACPGQGEWTRAHGQGKSVRQESGVSHVVGGGTSRRQMSGEGWNRAPDARFWTCVIFGNTTGERLLLSKKAPTVSVRPKNSWADMESLK